MEDVKIIELYWARNEEAIAETDRKYGRFCGSIAMRILQRREESEECVSDTWLQAWNSIPPQRPSAFRAWLGKVTRNLALSRYRKTHAEKRGGGQMELALEELQECIADQNGGDTADRLVIVAALERFLDELPEMQRYVFMQRYWHMRPVSEIAAECGMTGGQTASMLFRCRGRLRKLLEEEGIAV